jgi:hypothetical protein
MASLSSTALIIYDLARIPTIYYYQVAPPAFQGSGMLRKKYEADHIVSISISCQGTDCFIGTFLLR